MASHIHSHHFFSIFKNKEIDSLYFTVALIYFADGLISIFVPVYLWKLDFALWQIVFFYFLRSLYYLAVVFLLLPVLKRLSDKIMIFLSIPFLVLYFVGINYIGAVPALFYLLPVAMALHLLLFYLGYHTDFSGAADAGSEGKEVGTSLMIGSVVRFATPFIGGVLIGLFGFSYTFFLGSLVLLLAVIPLFFFPRRSLTPELSVKSVLQFIKDKEYRSFNLSRVGYGVEKVMFMIPWPIFLFFAVDGIEELGGVISLGLLVGAAVVFVSGYLSDVGKRGKLISLGSWGLALVWFIRTVLSHAYMIVGSHLVSQLFRDTLLAAWTTRYYKLARGIKGRRSEFILGQEVINHIARALILALAILLAYILPITQFFIASFIIAGLGSLLLSAASKAQS